MKNVFCIVSWNEEDIENALELHGVEVTPEKISYVVNQCIVNNYLEEQMIQTGWDVIYGIINNMEE
jgi:hypothetical protein